MVIFFSSFKNARCCLPIFSKVYYFFDEMLSNVADFSDRAKDMGTQQMHLSFTPDL